MKLALLQMNVKMGDASHNRETAARMIREAAKAGAETVVMPETWNLGFFPKENLEELAEEEGGESRIFLSRQAREYNINLIGGSLVTKYRDQIYNTAYAFDRLGVQIAEYHKIHAFSPSGEHNYFQRGNELCVFELEGIKAGLIICYDLRFTELVRLLALQGIQILFVPAQWPASRIEHWKVLNRARAIENQMYVACVNGCGESGESGNPYGGHSMLVSPLGEALIEASGTNSIALCDADFTQIADIRTRINVFQDRRTDVYHLSQEESMI